MSLIWEADSLDERLLLLRGVAQTPAPVGFQNHFIHIRHSGRIYDGYERTWANPYERRFGPRLQSKLGKAIHYALRQWPQLELYLTDGRIEIDNNLVENAIRPTKLGAKNWLFLGNVESGKKCAILYTIVENCRRLGINPREYLEDVLTRLPALKDSREATGLTPANWLADRTGKAARPAA